MEKFIYGLFCTCHPQKIRYVGVTTRGNKRLGQHRHLANYTKGKAYDSPLYRWMRKHGARNIESIILEDLTEVSDIFIQEKQWISKFQTFAGDRNGGVNSDRGGSGSEYDSLSQESKQKLSDRQRGSLNPMAKIDESDALRIKQMLFNGKSLRDISNELNVPYSSVSSISRNEKWNHVPWPGEYNVHKRPRMNKLKALEIREKLRKGTSRSKICSEYSIPYGTVVDIDLERTWK